MASQRTKSRTKEPSGSSNIAGYATPAGTKRFVSRFASAFSPEFYRPVADGITASSIGMGTYLGDCNDAEDARYVTVLSEGVERGLNLIDTAINYRCQRSERAVGKAISNIIANGIARRDELIIATKGGFIPLDGSPPSSRELYESFLKKEYFDRGIITPSDVVGGGHSISPGFIANQIQRSLRNLGVAAIDIYYVHNPEQQRTTLEPRQFRARMSAAFQELENQVDGGTIRAYGCATWHGFRQPSTASGHLSLEELSKIARTVGGASHHFKVVQLPVNLAMSEGVRAPTQTLDGKNVSLLQAAAELGVAVVASASLMQSQLTRGLPSQLANAFPALKTDAQRAIAFVRSLPLCSALIGMRSLEHLHENLGAGAHTTVA